MSEERLPRAKIRIDVQEDTVAGHLASADYAHTQAEAIEKTRGKVPGRDDNASKRVWQEYERAQREAAAAQRIQDKKEAA